MTFVRHTLLFFSLGVVFGCAVEQDTLYDDASEAQTLHPQGNLCMQVFAKQAGASNSGYPIQHRAISWLKREGYLSGSAGIIEEDTLFHSSNNLGGYRYFLLEGFGDPTLEEWVLAYNHRASLLEPDTFLYFTPELDEHGNASGSYGLHRAEIHQGDEIIVCLAQHPWFLDTPEELQAACELDAEDPSTELPYSSGQGIALPTNPRSGVAGGTLSPGDTDVWTRTIELDPLSNISWVNYRVQLFGVDTDNILIHTVFECADGSIGSAGMYKISRRASTSRPQNSEITTSTGWIQVKRARCGGIRGGQGTLRVTVEATEALDACVPYGIQIDHW